MDTERLSSAEGQHEEPLNHNPQSRSEVREPSRRPQPGALNVLILMTMNSS